MPRQMQVHELQAGMVLADDQGNTTDPITRTVVDVQVIGPISIIDFADGTATPPVNSSALATVEEPA